MTETAKHPTPAPSHKGLAIAALILGVVGLVLGPLGILTGVAAIVLAIIVLTKPAPEKGLAIGGLVSGVASILFGVAISILFGFVFSSGANFLNNVSKPNPAVEELIAAKKDFTQDETARVYTIDFTVLESQRNYTLNDEQKEACMPNVANVNPEASQESSADYVYVRATYKANNAPRVPLASNRYSIEENFRIQNARACYTNLGITSEGEKTAEYIYKVSKSASNLKLTNSLSVYTTALNSIVGGEGAPSEDVVYTIALSE